MQLSAVYIGLASIYVIMIIREDVQINDSALDIMFNFKHKNKKSVKILFV